MSEQKHFHVHIKLDPEWLASYRTATPEDRLAMRHEGVKFLYWYDGDSSPRIALAVPPTAA